MREVFGTLFVIAFDALVAVLSYWLFKALPITIACIATVILVVSAIAVTFSVLKYWKHRYIK
jgi:heme/copper-type cytochrome/quinol oxidase subunit 3